MKQLSSILVSVLLAFTLTGCFSPVSDSDDGSGGAGGGTNSTATGTHSGGNGGTTSSSNTGGNCNGSCSTSSTGGNGSSGNTSSSTGGNGSSTSSGGNGSCQQTVTYEIIANASDAESLRLEGADVSYNVQLKDSEFDPATGEPTAADWQIIPPGEKYANQATWTYIGCADGSFRFNVRGWSSVPHQGAPNNDAYACTIYWVDNLSPSVTVKRDGTVINYQNNLVNAAPNGDGRNCQANGH